MPNPRLTTKTVAAPTVNREIPRTVFRSQGREEKMRRGRGDLFHRLVAKRCAAQIFASS